MEKYQLKNYLDKHSWKLEILMNLLNDSELTKIEIKQNSKEINEIIDKYLPNIFETILFLRIINFSINYVK